MKSAALSGKVTVDQALKTAQVAALTTAQVGSLTTDQIVALTTEQAGALSSAQAADALAHVGPNVLRAETAGMAALATISLISQLE